MKFNTKHKKLHQLFLLNYSYHVLASKTLSERNTHNVTYGSPEDIIWPYLDLKVGKAELKGITLIDLASSLEISIFVSSCEGALVLSLLK